jgi:hypothetical protein
MMGKPPKWIYSLMERLPAGGLTNNYERVHAVNNSEKQPALLPTTPLASAKFFLRLTYDICFLLWLELIVLDLFISTADPYPYAAWAGTSAAVAFAVFAALRPAPVGRLVDWVSAFFTTALLVGASFYLRPLGAAEVWAYSAVIFAIATGARKRTAPGATVAFIRKCLLALILGWTAFAGYGALFPAALAGGVSNKWLGDGLGNYSLAQAPQQSGAILNGWGFVTTIVLALLIINALALAVSSLFEAVDGKYRLCNVVIISVSAAVLCSLLFSAQQSPVFLTIGTIPGTWLLALSLGGIGYAAAPPRLTQVRAKAPSRGSRRFEGGWVAGGVGALLIAAAVCHMLLAQRIRLYDGKLTPARYREYAGLSMIPQTMQDATIAMEDHSFYHHHGFDFVAMHHAIRMDIRDGRIEEGGSTITQQLAKNLFLTKDRTIWRKIQEAAYTVELEHDLSKHRILELYLNTIDYGYGCRGVTAAARYYFHETPAQLTTAQSAILVGLVPDPPQADPLYQSQGEPQYEDLSALQQGQQTALGRMAFFYPRRYTQADINAASSIPLERLVYPYKDAWDRGATSKIPAVWHGVGPGPLIGTVEIPNHIQVVNFANQRDLKSEFDYTLHSISDKSMDPSAFDGRSMLNSSSQITTTVSGKVVVVPGYRSNETLADQEERVYKDQQNSNI